MTQGVAQPGLERSARNREAASSNLATLTNPIYFECPPDYRWLFNYEGRLLPVTNLYDVFGDETNEPIRAHTLVAFGGRGEWIACQCYPEEIISRPQGWQE